MNSSVSPSLSLAIKTFGLYFFFIILSIGQIDIQTAKIDPNTTQFDDGKTTLQDYVYNELKEKTNCCGEDALYIEITVTKEGYVERVRALSGKNDCYKKSVVDILMPLQWDASKINTDKKNLYLELLPQLDCKGTPQDNIYKPIVYNVQRPISTSNQDSNVVKEEAKPQITSTEPSKQDTLSSPPPSLPHKQPTSTSSDTTKPKRIKPKFAHDLPPPKYVSTGEKHPDSSHIGSYVNMPGLRIPEPEYIDGPSAMAIFIKKELKKRGVCGLIHLLAEITIDKGGKVIDHRILNINRNDIVEYIPEILFSLRFKPETVPIRTNTYIEFKADISCGTVETPRTDLAKIPDYILTPEEEEIKGQKGPESQKEGEELALPKDE